MARTSAGGLRDVGRRAGEVFMLDPEQIVVEEGYNVRDWDQPELKHHIDELAKSIAEIGVQNPIQVRWDKGQAILVNGECRLRGTLQARKHTGHDIKIPSILSKLTEPERVAALITMNEGKPLTPLEQAKVFARLRAFGWSDAEISKKVGKSTAHVNAMLKLYEAPEPIKELVASGKVAAFNAVDVLRHSKDTDEALEKMQEAVAEASAKGKDRASAKKLKDRGKSKTDTPIYYQRTVVKSLIDALVEIAANTSLPRSVRDNVKDTLDNADVDWKEWLRDMAEAEQAS